MALLKNLGQTHCLPISLVFYTTDTHFITYFIHFLEAQDNLHIIADNV